MMLSKLIIFWFRKQGWRFVGPLPKHSKKAVIVFGPHTNFKDILLARAILMITRFETHIVVKKHYFRFPLISHVLKKWKCIPFDFEQSPSFNLVLEKGMTSNEPFSITIPFQWRGESESNHWLHGVALKHNAPMVAVAISHDTKTVKIHSLFNVSNNKKTEWQFVRTFLSRYKGNNGGRNNIESLKEGF